MALILAVDKFLAEVQTSKTLLLDTRSPAEYIHAHIPGAVNLPLLDNEQRAIIGTTFKREGREAAILKGFDLVGPRFGDFIRKVKSKTEEHEIFLYCWRGGLRSSIMSWVLTQSGYQVTLLKGGYKSYRNWVLSELKKDRAFLVLGGRTGSGKTEILNAIGSREPVVDLEALAHHKGSAFGHLGQLPQPGNEQFENLLAQKLSSLPLEDVIWIENESTNIGSVKIPDKIYQAIRDSTVIEILLDDAVRKKRILDEYGTFPVDQLAETTKRIRKRLGEVRLKEALDHLQNGRLEKWTEMMMEYYDKMYNYGMSVRKPDSIFRIDVSPLSDAGAAAEKVIGIKSLTVRQAV